MEVPIVNMCTICKQIFTSVWNYRTHLKVHDLCENLDRKIVQKVVQSAEYKQQEYRQLNKNQTESAKEHVAQRPPQRLKLSCERQLKEKKHMKSPHISKTVKRHTRRQEAQLQPLTPQERTIESLAPQEYKQQEDRQLNKHQQQNAKQHVAQRRSQTRRLSYEKQPKEKNMESLYISQDTSSSPQKETVEPLCTPRETINSSSISSPGVEKSFQETALYLDLQGSSSSLTIEGPLKDPPLVTFKVPSQDLADLSTPFLTPKRHLQDHFSYQAVKEPCQDLHGLSPVVKRAPRDLQDNSSSHAVEEPFQDLHVPSSASPNVERAPHDLQDHSSFHAVEDPCHGLHGPSQAVERAPRDLQDHSSSHTVEEPCQDLHGPSSSSSAAERTHDLQDHSSFHAVEKPCQDLHGPSSACQAVERVPHDLQDRYPSQIFALPSSQDLHGFSTPFQRLENPLQDLQSFPDIEGPLSPSPALEGQLSSCVFLPAYIHPYITEPLFEYDDFGYRTHSGLYVNKHRRVVVQPCYEEPSSGYEGPSSSQTETAEPFCTSQETNSSPISSSAVEKTSQEPSLSSDLQGPSSSTTIEGLCGNLQNPSFPQTLERPLKDAPSWLNFEVPSHDLHSFFATFQRLENHSQDLECSSLSLTDIEGPSPAPEGQLPFSKINSTLSPYAEDFFPRRFFAQFSPNKISTLSPYAQEFYPGYFFSQAHYLE